MCIFYRDTCLTTYNLRSFIAKEIRPCAFAPEVGKAEPHITWKIEDQLLSSQRIMISVIQSICSLMIKKLGYIPTLATNKWRASYKYHVIMITWSPPFAST